MEEEDPFRVVLYSTLPVLLWTALYWFEGPSTP